MPENKIVTPQIVIPKPMDFKMDLQLFARDPEDVEYRGRRRWNGSYGRVWWDGQLLFEISKFNGKVVADREDVLIGNSKDSKIVSLTGEGSFTIKSVINRNINKYLEEWKNGHDPRANLVGLIDDPDAVDGQKERCSIDNVWFNELTLMNFEKGQVVEKEFPFGFTPEDASFIETVSD